MEWTEVRGHIESEIKRFHFEHDWKRVEVGVHPSQSRKNIVAGLYGTTHDDRMFLVWMILGETDFSEAYIQTGAANACCTLDTFLDKECSCVPKKAQLLAEHCEYHKKLFGY